MYAILWKLEKVPYFRIFRRDWSFFFGWCWFLRESHFRWLIVEWCYDAGINCNYSIQTYFFSARELIFTESDVLVSPAFDDKTSLLLIVKVCLNHNTQWPYDLIGRATRYFFPCHLWVWIFFYLNQLQHTTPESYLLWTD